MIDKSTEIIGVSFFTFLIVIMQFKKNVRLVGQYNSNFDNAFIYEIGRRIGVLKHVEHEKAKEIILNSKQKYLEYLKKHEKDEILGEIEIIKVNNKLYRLAIKNWEGKTITIDDDWLLFDYDLRTKGEIIKLAKGKNMDYENVPWYKKATDLKKDNNWYPYLANDGLITRIHHQVMVEYWATQKLDGFNKVNMTKSSLAKSLHEKDFSEMIINEHIKAKDISEPYRKKIQGRDIKIVDLHHKAEMSKYYENPIKKDYLNYNFLVKKIMEYFFPTDFLLADENEQALEMYYHKVGGMVHLNQELVDEANSYLNMMTNRKSRRTYKLAKIDINSSYPAVMNSEKIKCPIGQPLKCNKYNAKYYQMIKLIPKHYIAKEKTFMPLFRYQINKKNVWVHNLKKGVPLYIDTNQWKYFNQHYKLRDFIVEYQWTFKCVSMRRIFGVTMEREYANKAKYKNVNDALYRSAKIILNSIFGKWITKYKRTASYHDEEQDKWVSYQYYIKGYFMPIGIAVLNAARLTLCNAVGENYKYFKYCDTDSLFLLVPSHLQNLPAWLKKVWHITIDNKKLGAWDLEGVYDLWSILQPKRYLLWRSGECVRKMAGYKFGEYDIDNLEVPNIGTEAWKRLITVQWAIVHIREMIEGFTFKNQTASHYMVGYGKMIVSVVKEVKPIFESYMMMEKNKYYHQHCVL